MNKRLCVFSAALTVGIVALGACSKKTDSGGKKVGEFVQEQDSFPRVRYFDSNRMSLNDRCAVRHTRLNPEVPPVYVNGQPIGFC